MRLGGWPYPVVVDLAGMRVTRKSRPILKDHDRASIVGHTDDIMVGELMCLRIKRLPVNHGKTRTLDMGDEIAVRPPCDHCNLYSGFAQRGQRLGQFHFLAGIASR